MNAGESRMNQKNLIIYGNGSFAQLIKWYIDHDDERHVAAVTVEKSYIKASEFEGLPLIPFEEIEKSFSASEYEILICIGYSNMNNNRMRIFHECKKRGFSAASYIHTSARLSDSSLGEGNIILENTLIQPFVKIGDGNIIWYNTSIAHNCTIGNFNNIAGMASLCGFVEIGNNCFIGNGAIIREETSAADYTLAGAGSYVDKDTKPYQVIVPGRSIVLEGKTSMEFI